MIAATHGIFRLIDLKASRSGKPADPKPIQALGSRPLPWIPHNALTHKDIFGL